jgi:hypothetical protein
VIDSLDLQSQVNAGTLSEKRVRLLAALGYPPALALFRSQPALRLSRPDERPTWECFSWWFADLARIDPTAVVAAAVVIGEHLLRLCEVNAYDGEFDRIVARLRRAWAEEHGGSGECLRDMAVQIEALNEAECALDSGSAMPTERVAARAMTQLALEFSGGEPADWLANAAEGLEIADPSFDRFAIEAELKAGLVQMVLQTGA